MVSTDCSWCRQLSSLERRSDVVWEFPHSVAFLGPWQFYQGYCILVHRQHLTELSQMPTAKRRGYLDEMCILARAIEEAFRPHKLNYELLGNLVPHLHWHLFPRYLTDRDRLLPVWHGLRAAERSKARANRLRGVRVDRAATVRLLRKHLRKLGLL